MRDLRLSCVVVCEEMCPVGVISERDMCKVLASISETGKMPGQVAAREVMSSPVLTTRPESTLAATSFRMQQHGIRRLPVEGLDGLLGQVGQAEKRQDLVAALDLIGPGTTPAEEIAPEASVPGPDPVRHHQVLTH